MDDDLCAADVPQLSPLSRLPHELLLLVARQLALADFCALRLASQHISSMLRVLLAGADFVGEPWRDNAARLDALAGWPECAQQIRRVRIQSRAVYEDEEQMAWDEDCADPEPPVWGESRAAAANPAAHRLAPLRADLLAEALCRLPRLEELSLTWERRPFKSRQETGVRDDDDHLANADPDVARQLQYTTGAWQVEMLVDLAADLPPLRALRMAPLALEAMDQARYLPLIANLFNSLVRLDLQLSARAQRTDPAVLSKLEDLLAAAWVLQTLRLDLDDDGGGPAELRRVVDFLPRTTIPHLQELTLVSAALKLRDLDTFLRRHACTLQSLTLEHVRGAGPGQPLWDDIFQTIGQHLTELTSAKVRGHMSDHRYAVTFQHGAGEEAGNENGKMKTIDPAPLERYLTRQGEFPTLPWIEHFLD